MSNAGIPYTIPVELLPLDDLRRVFEVNCVGLLAVTQVRMCVQAESRPGVWGYRVTHAPIHFIYLSIQT